MYELMTVAFRYFFMIIFGALAAKGYFDNSLIEPLVGFSLAVIAAFWFYWTKVRTVPEKGDPLDKVQEHS